MEARPVPPGNLSSKEIPGVGSFNFVEGWGGDEEEDVNIDSDGKDSGGEDELQFAPTRGSSLLTPIYRTPQGTEAPAGSCKASIDNSSTALVTVRERERVGTGLSGNSERQKLADVSSTPIRSTAPKLPRVGSGSLSSSMEGGSKRLDAKRFRRQFSTPTPGSKYPIGNKTEVPDTGRMRGSIKAGAKELDDLSKGRDVQGRKVNKASRGQVQNQHAKQVSRRLDPGRKDFRDVRGSHSNNLQISKQRDGKQTADQFLKEMTKKRTYREYEQAQRAAERKSSLRDRGELSKQTDDRLRRESGSSGSPLKVKRQKRDEDSKTPTPEKRVLSKRRLEKDEVSPTKVHAPDKQTIQFGIPTTKGVQREISSIQSKVVPSEKRTPPKRGLRTEENCRLPEASVAKQRTVFPPAGKRGLEIEGSKTPSRNQYLHMHKRAKGGLEKTEISSLEIFPLKRRTEKDVIIPTRVSRDLGVRKLAAEPMHGRQEQDIGTSRIFDKGGKRLMSGTNTEDKDGMDKGASEKGFELKPMEKVFERKRVTEKGKSKVDSPVTTPARVSGQLESVDTNEELPKAAIVHALDEQTKFDGSGVVVKDSGSSPRKEIESAKENTFESPRLKVADMAPDNKTLELLRPQDCSDTDLCENDEPVAVFTRRRNRSTEKPKPGSSEGIVPDKKVVEENDEVIVLQEEIKGPATSGQVREQPSGVSSGQGSLNANLGGDRVVNLEKPNLKRKQGLVWLEMDNDTMILQSTDNGVRAREEADKNLEEEVPVSGGQSVKGSPVEVGCHPPEENTLPASDVEVIAPISTVDPTSKGLFFKDIDLPLTEIERLEEGEIGLDNLEDKDRAHGELIELGVQREIDKNSRLSLKGISSGLEKVARLKEDDQTRGGTRAEDDGTQPVQDTEGGMPINMALSNSELTKKSPVALPGPGDTFVESNIRFSNQNENQHLPNKRSQQEMPTITVQEEIRPSHVATGKLSPVETSHLTPSAQFVHDERSDSDDGRGSDHHNSYCEGCKQGGELICCDGSGCRITYHLECTDPTLSEVPSGDWYCPNCSDKGVSNGAHSVSKLVESVWDVRDFDDSYSPIVIQTIDAPGSSGAVAKDVDGVEVSAGARRIQKSSSTIDAGRNITQTERRFSNGDVNRLDANFVPDMREIQGNGPMALQSVSISATHGKKEYFVKWKGRSHAHNTWVAETELLQLQLGAKVIAKFKKKVEEGQLPKWNPDWAEPQRLLQRKPFMPPVRPGGGRGRGYLGMNSVEEWFVKWKGLGYEHCTWETYPSTVLSDALSKELLSSFEKCCESAGQRQHPYQKEKARKLRESSFKRQESQPEWMQFKQLLPYQLERLNTLCKYWHLHLNPVMVDEDDQEKISAVVAMLLCLIKEYGVYRPFLLVVPQLAIESWEVEISEYASHVYTVVYTGGKEAKGVIQRFELSKYNTPRKVQLVLTTYEAACSDLEYFSTFEWEAVIVDDNQQSKLSKFYRSSLQFRDAFRLVLVNEVPKCNVEEFQQMLHFLKPPSLTATSEFRVELMELDENAQLSHLKNQLLEHIVMSSKPDDSFGLELRESWLAAPMTSIQVHLYCNILTKHYNLLISGRLRSESDSSSLHELMTQLRLCCQHPYLVDPTLQESINRISLPASQTLSEAAQLLLEAGIAASGKLQCIHEMLSVIHSKGGRVLIISQFLLELLILEDYVRQTYGVDSYELVDTRYSAQKKSNSALKFNARDSSRFVFLLRTGSSGVSLKLRDTDTVIIHDSDINPANDVQYLRKVLLKVDGDLKVFRLYNRLSVEEGMMVYARQANLEPDPKPVHAKLLQQILRWKVHRVLSLDTASSVQSILQEEKLKGKGNEILDDIKRVRNILQGNIGMEESSDGIVDDVWAEEDVESLKKMWSALLKDRYAVYMDREEQLKTAKGLRQRKKVLYSEEALALAPYSAAEEEEVRKKRRRPQILDTVSSLPRDKPRDILSHSAVPAPKQSESLHAEESAHGNDLSLRTIPDVQSMETADLEGCSAGQQIDHEPPRVGQEQVRKQVPKHRPQIQAPEMSGSSLDPQNKSIRPSSDEARKLRMEQKQQLLRMEPELAKICEILQVSEGVANYSQKLLSYVMNKFKMPKAPRELVVLVEISLCLIAAARGNEIVEHLPALSSVDESMNLRLKNEEFKSVYERLEGLCKQSEAFPLVQQGAGPVEMTLPEVAAGQLQHTSDQHKVLQQTDEMPAMNRSTACIEQQTEIQLPMSVGQVEQQDKTQMEISDVATAGALQTEKVINGDMQGQSCPASLETQPPISLVDDAGKAKLKLQRDQLLQSCLAQQKTEVTEFALASQKEEDNRRRQYEEQKSTILGMPGDARQKSEMLRLLVDTFESQNKQHKRELDKKRQAMNDKQKKIRKDVNDLYIRLFEQMSSGTLPTMFAEAQNMGLNFGLRSPTSTDIAHEPNVDLQNPVTIAQLQVVSPQAHPYGTPLSPSQSLPQFQSLSPPYALSRPQSPSPSQTQFQRRPFSSAESLSQLQLQHQTLLLSQNQNQPSSRVDSVSQLVGCPLPPSLPLSPHVQIETQSPQSGRQPESESVGQPDSQTLPQPQSGAQSPPQPGSHQQLPSAIELLFESEDFMANFEESVPESISLLGSGNDSLSEIPSQSYSLPELEPQFHLQLLEQTQSNLLRNPSQSGSQASAQSTSSFPSQVSARTQYTQPPLVSRSLSQQSLPGQERSLLSSLHMNQQMVASSQTALGSESVHLSGPTHQLGRIQPMNDQRSPLQLNSQQIDPMTEQRSLQQPTTQQLTTQQPRVVHMAQPAPNPQSRVMIHSMQPRASQLASSSSSFQGRMSQSAHPLQTMQPRTSQNRRQQLSSASHLQSNRQNPLQQGMPIAAHGSMPVSAHGRGPLQPQQLQSGVQGLYLVNAGLSAGVTNPVAVQGRSTQPGHNASPTIGLNFASQSQLGPDPLAHEVNRLRKEQEKLKLTFDIKNTEIKAQWERELEELRKRHEGLLQENLRIMETRNVELEEIIEKVDRNRRLAEALKWRSYLDVQKGRPIPSSSSNPGGTTNSSVRQLSQSHQSTVSAARGRSIAGSGSQNIGASISNFTGRSTAGAVINAGPASSTTVASQNSMPRPGLWHNSNPQNLATSMWQSPNQSVPATINSSALTHSSPLFTHLPSELTRINAPGANNMVGDSSSPLQSGTLFQGAFENLYRPHQVSQSVLHDAGQAAQPRRSWLSNSDRVSRQTVPPFGTQVEQSVSHQRHLSSPPARLATTTVSSPIVTEAVLVSESPEILSNLELSANDLANSSHRNPVNETFSLDDGNNVLVPSTSSYPVAPAPVAGTGNTSSMDGDVRLSVGPSHRLSGFSVPSTMGLSSIPSPAGVDFIVLSDDDE